MAWEIQGADGFVVLTGDPVPPVRFLQGTSRALQHQGPLLAQVGC